MIKHGREQDGELGGDGPRDGNFVGFSVMLSAFLS